MPALTSDRDTPARQGDRRSGPVVASARVFAGALLMRTSAGLLAPGATATGAVGVGRADAPANNTSGAAGAIRADWRPGTFRFDNLASDAVTAADLGKLCFIVDDATVARTNGSGARSPAGVIEDVDAAGVWVRMDEALTRATA